MTQHRSEAELNDYADGVLSSSAADEVERHLEICAECQDQVERIRALTARLAAIPRAAEPARDLWPLVAVRADEEEADAPEGEAGVIPFRPRRPAPAADPAAWMWRAAAAVVLFAGGLGAGWAAKPPVEKYVAAPSTVVNETPTTDPALAAANVKKAGEEYVAAVANFASLTSSATKDNVSDTRSAVLASIGQSASQLRKISADDAGLANQIVRAVSNELGPSGDPVTTVPRSRYDTVPGEQFY
jgi:anti-sigma-K factor RskA